MAGVGIGRKTWPTGLRVLLAVLVAAAGILLALDGTGFFTRYNHHHTTLIDGASVGAAIGQQLTSDLGQEQTVDCPNAPARPGYIFDCTMIETAQGGGWDVRVVENDRRGHFTWQVTQQQVGPAFQGVPPGAVSGVG